MMKIQGSSPNHEASATTRLEQVRSERQGKADRSGDAGTDRVELSQDAQFAANAVRAAQDAPAVRQDVVERARQKLMAGEIGQDPLKLADRLIDHLLER
jgi:flagellar biosynthesis anti-sigma factor FlgM